MAGEMDFVVVPAGRLSVYAATGWVTFERSVEPRMQFLPMVRPSERRMRLDVGASRGSCMQRRENIQVPIDEAEAEEAARGMKNVNASPAEITTGVPRGAAA